MARVDTHPDPQIGAALRWLRNRAGLQQREVSDRMGDAGAGVSTVWLSQVENGRQKPSRHLVRQLAELYGIHDAHDLDDLIARRPWESEGLAVLEGSEWEGVRPQLVASLSTSNRASSKGGADLSLARSLAELNELFLRLSDDDRATLLRHARSLVLPHRSE